MRVSSHVFQAPVPVGGTGAFEVHVVDRHHPRVHLGAHRHADLEVIFFERGGGEHIVDNDRYEIRPGDLYLVPPGQVHDLSRMADSAHGWAIEFSPAAINGSTSRESRAPWRASPLLFPFVGSPQDGGVPTLLQVPPEERESWTARCYELQREYQGTAPGRALAMSANLVLLMISIARMTAAPSGVRNGGDPLLEKVFAAINQGWARDLHPRDIASQVGLSPAYLTTLVRERTGRPLSVWIMERRMSEARTLLLATDRSVESIAIAVGYPDPTHFSRRFRQMHGMPPGQWRKNSG